MAHIGIVHPGEMGAWVAQALRDGGHEVLWASDGRSPATCQRAHATGLVDHGDLRGLAEACDAIISVCPPGAALATAEAVVGAGFDAAYVDANAIAPDTARRIQALVETAGGTMVDGGIVGGTADEPGETRLYLSGFEAPEVATWFTTGRPEAVVDGAVGAASAVKVGFAGWTKGSAALLLAMRAYARAEGVEDEVLDAWDHGLADPLGERSERYAGSIHRKAWRFVGEMEQLGAALAATGLPAGFHAGAAAMYAALADLKDQPVPQDPDVVLRRLARGTD